MTTGTAIAKQKEHILWYDLRGKIDYKDLESFIDRNTRFYLSHLDVPLIAVSTDELVLLDSDFLVTDENRGVKSVSYKYLTENYDIQEEA